MPPILCFVLITQRLAFVGLAVQQLSKHELTPVPGPAWPAAAPATANDSKTLISSFIFQSSVNGEKGEALTEGAVVVVAGKVRGGLELPGNLVRWDV
uniref:Putative secreted protein n=1 Tax=Anopheles darlingi TaxID=43151 RepID=A0A2M4DEW9_ANODA